MKITEEDRQAVQAAIEEIQDHLVTHVCHLAKSGYKAGVVTAALYQLCKNFVWGFEKTMEQLDKDTKDMN